MPLGRLPSLTWDCAGADTAMAGGRAGHPELRPGGGGVIPVKCIYGRWYVRRVGLAEELSYSFPRPNVLQRSVKALVATRPGSLMLSLVLPPLDRTLERLSDGRTSAPRLLVGVPVITLTSTGRKTGLPRDTYLVGIPVGDALAVLGTNFGRPDTPAWVHNLEADPRATVGHGGVTVDVTARHATQEERARVLAGTASVYGGYLKYLGRISGRDVRIFVLERAPAA